MGVTDDNLPLHKKGSADSEQRFEYDLNPYESFMRKHLQHYGYYTGRNTAYKNAFSAFAEWDKTKGLEVSDDSSCNSDEEDDKHGTALFPRRPRRAKQNHDDHQDSDNKTQEELMRTTQLVYSYQAGKMVPKLREPRQLFGFNPETGGINQGSRWPSEIQVLNERVYHNQALPAQPEPFYVKTGLERTPMSRSHEGQGRIVYEYEPVIGSFNQMSSPLAYTNLVFLRSRVGGCRTGCTRVTPELSDDNDDTLIFESRFESGNLYKAVQVGDHDYELWLRNDLYTNKHTQWFYFRVSNTRPNVNYRFTIVNLMKPDSLYNNGMKPCCYSEKDADDNNVGWIRNGKDIKYYRNNIRYMCGKTERSYYSLTWTCQFAHTKDTVYFAHCYPYTYTDLQDYLNDIAVDPVRSKLCKQRVLCRTLAGNLVYVLTITTPTKTPEDMKHRKAVVITSRVHPGETNASWMMKGFMDYLLGTSADAKLLRDTFVFKIIPMLNPDGVIVGNYRCSLAGRDLNRNYKTVLKDSFPSVWHTRTMMKKLLEERDIVMYCDLHGHSRRQNVFIYGCENRASPQRRLRERVFPVMLSKNAPDKFCYESCKFKVQKSKEGTGRVVCWNLGIMNSFTMEATFCGSSIGKKKGYHFSTADFEALGFHFCDTLLDYCDPDTAKAARILADLEEKMRQEILLHLRQREGNELPDLGEINLEADFTSAVESSDGGSDSSVSDGLPAHLQYIAQKQFPKKKRLKTRKERDKHKCPPEDTKKLQATPITMEPDKKDLKPKTKVTTKRPKSQEEKDRANAATSTRDLQDERMKKSEGYLEALTNAYIRSGVLNPDQTQARVPHFRYTGASHQVANVPVTFDGLASCHHSDQAFAAQYVANHLQQFKYPGPQADRIISGIRQLAASSASALDSKSAPSAPRRLPSLVTLFTYNPESSPGVTSDPVTPDLQRRSASSRSVLSPPRASVLVPGGHLVPQITLDDSHARVLKYSKRAGENLRPIESLRPLDHRLHVIQPAEAAILMQFSPSTIRADDLSELPKYKYSLRKPGGGSSARGPGGPGGSDPTLSQVPAILDRRPSHRHLVELSAGQTRQQEIQDTDPEDPNNPGRHPSEDNLEREQSYDALNKVSQIRLVSNTDHPSSAPKPRRPGSSSTVARSRSARAQSALSRGWGAEAGLDENTILGPSTDASQRQGATDLSSDSRQSSATSTVRVKSAHRHGNRLPLTNSVPYVAASRHGSMVPPSTSEYVPQERQSRERISSTFTPSQHAPPTPSLPGGGPSSRGSKRQSASIPAIYPTHTSERSGRQGHGRQGNGRQSNGRQGHARPVDTQSASLEMTQTMRSINEIRDSLLDPEKRANLSPTTGHFVEHFIKKTDAEISDISAELEGHLQTRQPPSSQLSMLQEMFNLANAAPATNGPPGGATSHANGPPGGATVSSPGGSRKAAGRVSRDGTKPSSGEFYPDPSVARASVAKQNSSSSLLREPPIQTIPRRGNQPGNSNHSNNTQAPGNSGHSNQAPGNSGHSNQAPSNSGHSNQAPSNSGHSNQGNGTNTNMNNNSLDAPSPPAPPPRVHTSELTFSLPSNPTPSGGATSQQLLPYRGGPQAEMMAAAASATRGQTESGGGGEYGGRDDTQNGRVPSAKRTSSSPTKISLVISRGHNQESASNGNQGNHFHAYSLTRGSKPPSLNRSTMPRR